MAKYSHDSIVPYSNSGEGKKQQVSDMFNRIAFRYDFLNRFLSAGIDKGWRRKAIAQLRDLQPGLLLDVATGTADMPILIAQKMPGWQIIGIDISAGMLEIGQQKLAKRRLNTQITLQEGDSEAINFPDGTFDAITVAFGVRNFENLEKGLKEMLRVLKPGGKLVILEFSKPRTPGFKQLYQFYLGKIAPGVVQLFSRKQAYQYLNKSVQSFPEGQTLINILHESGFTQTYLKPLSLGICTIYCGSKQGS